MRSCGRTFIRCPRWRGRPAGKRSAKFKPARSRSSSGCEETGDPLVFVSHADVVRVILGHYLRLDLQHVRQMRIDHASVSALDLTGDLVTLLCLNYTPDLGAIK